MSGDEGRDHRNVIFACTGQSIVAFCHSYAALVIPFYIAASGVIGGRDLSAAEALVWAGAVIAVSGIAEILGSLLWSYLADRVSIRFLYARGVWAHAVLFALFAFALDVRWMLVLRILQGLLGGVSTIGLIIISASRSDVRAMRVGFFQGAMTMGQVFGPLAASVVITVWGYMHAFYAAAGILAMLGIVSPFVLKEIPELKRGRKRPNDRVFCRQARLNPVLMLGGLLLVLAAGCNVSFLRPLLPRIVGEFGVEVVRAPLIAGIIVGASGAAESAGGVLFGRLAKRIDETMVLMAVVVVGAVMVAAQGIAGSLMGFAALRTVQMFAMAAVFPLVVAMVSDRHRGSTMIGTVNGARLLATSVGPLGGSFLYSVWGKAVVFWTMAGVSMVCLVGYLIAESWWKRVRNSDIQSEGM